MLQAGSETAAAGDRSNANLADLPSSATWFHNLRKAVSDYLNEGKKADVRTIQDMLRHENPEMTLSKYTESSLQSRLAAQEVMADAILAEVEQA
jgi:integrase